MSIKPKDKKFWFSEPVLVVRFDRTTPDGDFWIVLRPACDLAPEREQSINAKALTDEPDLSLQHIVTMYQLGKKSAPKTSS